GRVPKDYDVATDALPDAVRDLFGRRRTLAVGASFGVIVVVGTKQSGNIEVATFRTEGPYADGRRPDHVDFSTPEEDAQRRDFTINGMFYDPIAEQVHDYVGGEADLAAGIVRAIGKPADRMSEDKLRLLRAVRFAATMDFALDPKTAEAVRLQAHEIRIVSAERITQELQKMLVDPHRRRAMDLARELGLLAEIVPELAPVISSTTVAETSPPEWAATLRRLQLLNEPVFELAAAALLLALPNSGAAATAICKRLRMSNDETEAIGWLLQHVAEVRASKTKSLAQLKRLLAHANALNVVELARVDAMARDGDLSCVMHCEEILRQTPRERLDPPPLVTGDDLIALGLEPGRFFGQILDAVRDEQLNEKITTKDEAMAFVRRFLDQHGTS
ncbi:MAG TPA: CCA tRNA nucleotidyltransferase, partial [Planctomycetaceae bacterium]|nr:CCA tRNA nucleotidyltransferase [Planctomycetaceae bacterium]